VTRRRDAWVEVDLGAIAANVSVIRDVVGPGVRVAPVVKAEAYGHGLVPVARALRPLVDALCVATLDEALALRAADVGGRIVLLYPVPTDACEEAVDAGIELTVMSEDDAEAVVRAASDPTRSSVAWRPEAAGRARGAGVHLAIDTGMTRGGIRPEAAATVARRLSAVPRTVIAGTWTHLCCPDDAATSSAQVGRFEAALRALADARLPTGERHVAASGGIFAASAPVGDLVRPGLATYGVLPDDLPLASRTAGAAAALRPALSLKARAVAFSEIAPGTSVGYGATWQAERPSRIATLPVGYGDGYARATQPGAWVLVGGRRAPVVGIVSMDAIGVDVTGLEGVDARSEFVLLGRQGDERIEAGELARQRNTIAWEVLSGMAARLDRVYHPGTAAGEARDTT
jgi:alanine racemase